MSAIDRDTGGHGLELVSFLTTDLVGITRGRSVIARDLDSYLRKGVGWVPANLALTPFDTIASANPWGSTGDLRLIPDAGTRTRITSLPGATPLHFYLSDITDLDGAPWDCCVRGILKQALADFHAETGLQVVAAFEQEFQIAGASWPPAPSFSLAALRRADPFGPLLMAALDEAGVEPENFLPEYGADQFEITCKPTGALAACDRAVVIRAVVRELAARMGWRATFAPKSAPGGVGNGVHIHLSLLDQDGEPALFDAACPGRVSEVGGQLAAGIVRHLPALCALTAPSVLSYLRLVPHHWSAAFTCLGEHNREAALRICPTVGIDGSDPARQLNLELRAADATASPYLALAAVLRAGLQGIRERLPRPPLVNRDPSTLEEADRAQLGVKRLPSSLDEALRELRRDEILCGTLPSILLACYEGVKATELELVTGLTPAELCDRYAAVY
jgi:glutamine synthetase